MDVLTNFLSSLVGSLIAVIIVLLIERQRRPKLSITIGEPGWLQKNDPYGRPEVKWLNIYIHNEKMPWWIRWVYRRDPATTCRAWITFHHLDGHKIFSQEMVARWNETPQPEFVTIETEKEITSILKNPLQNSVDIPPDEYTDIAIVIKENGEDDCYGWNNDSYRFNWKHPDRRLEKGRYIARARVKTMGKEFSETFLIINDVGYKEFRLEATSKEQKRRVEKLS